VNRNQDHADGGVDSGVPAAPRGALPDPPSSITPQGPPASLSDRKVRAAELITTGMKLKTVAEQVGISPEQLWRWRQEQAFIQFLGRLRLEHHQARVNRIWSLSDVALDVVEESLQEGDPKAAMDLLKLVGPGLTDITLSWANPTSDRGATTGASIKCDSCDTPIRTEAGLRRHIQARHGR